MGAPLKRDAEGNEGGSHVTIWGRCLPDGEKSQYTCPQARATLCLAVPGGPVMERREWEKAQVEMRSKRNQGQIMQVLQDNEKDIVLSEMEI